MPSTVTSILDGLSTSVAVKAPVKAASTGPLTLAGEQTIDSVACVEGDRVLVKDQATASENGIYVVSTGLWSRAKDFDGQRDVRQGTLVVIGTNGDTGLYYRVTSSNPITIGTSDINFELVGGSVTQAIIGGLLYPETEGEVSADLTPTDYAKAPHNYDVRRAGIVPNDSGAASTNTVALKALVGRSDGFVTDPLIFPNTTGSDTYYFDDIVLLKDGAHLQLNGCKLNFSKTAQSSDTNSGCLHLIRNVIIENGTIEVDYDPAGTSTNGFIPIYLGARGTNSSHITVFDSLLSERMGNIILRNLTITANTELGTAIAGVGGLRNVIMENIKIDGQDALQQGVYFEFGWATNESNNYERQTSHPNNMYFRNIEIKNCTSSGGGSGLAFGLNGCYNCTIDGLIVTGCTAAFAGGTGESLFYRPWEDEDDIGAGYNIIVRRLICPDATGTAVALTGAVSSSSGYLSSLSLGDDDETDLADYVLDGFVIGNSAILCSARSVVFRNGAVINGGGSGAIVLTAECSQWSLENVACLNGSASGLRVGDISAFWSPARKSNGRVIGCKFAGNTNAAILLANTQSVIIESCRFGYQSGHDGVAESTQTSAVSVASTASGVICRNNQVSVASGNAYVLAGTGPRRCDIVNPSGTATTSGLWNIDGTAVVTASNISSATHNVNTEGKYLGRRALDTSNSRLMIALGASSSSAWAVADGSTSVTPTT